MVLVRLFLFFRNTRSVFRARPQQTASFLARAEMRIATRARQHVQYVTSGIRRDVIDG